MNKIIKAFKPIVIWVSILIFAFPTSVVANEAISPEAEEHILSNLSRANIPCAAVAVIQDGETSYIFKNSTYDTLFQIGSVAKSFTGFGILLLEDMGLLSIYDPVNMHLPWFKASYNGQPVPYLAIYHLLQNASGITNDERLFPMARATETTEEFITRLSLGFKL